MDVTCGSKNMNISIKSMSLQYSVSSLLSIIFQTQLLPQICLPIHINMRSSIIQILCLAASLAYATAIPDAPPKEDLVARENPKASLEARASCKCKKVSNAGLYCGFCTTSNGVGPGNAYYNTVPYDNVAWCNTSGGCEDYGYSSHCAARESRGCKGIDKW